MLNINGKSLLMFVIIVVFLAFLIGFLFINIGNSLPEGKLRSALITYGGFLIEPLQVILALIISGAIVVFIIVILRMVSERSVC